MSYCLLTAEAKRNTDAEAAVLNVVGIESQNEIPRTARKTDIEIVIEIEIATIMVAGTGTVSVTEMGVGREREVEVVTTTGIENVIVEDEAEVGTADDSCARFIATFVFHVCLICMLDCVNYHR